MNTQLERLYKSCTYHCVVQEKIPPAEQSKPYEKIRAAWDKISQLADLEGQPEKVIHLEKIWKVLNEPPYGYSSFAPFC